MWGGWRVGLAAPPPPSLPPSLPPRALTNLLSLFSPPTADVGTQYRSGLYFHNEAQKAAIASKIAEVDEKLAAGTFRRVVGKKVVAEVAPAGDFYAAENYHQQYLSKGGRFGQKQSAAKGCNDPIKCYG